ncbi:uncharacterized protein SAPINGB_P000337 [Magnusiomyces paraingens]|uniref:Mitochondrial carrier protein n=1 Tax=Magnusiomyces paraingens TaxID=2606893 RepID=A0A5E8B069_9ASCO|nr:uncharacterized protein SAPINGB_P000337 [Saprochaete ingens]VVT44200.1 unnamed protein product [Saprochaete ingens]
MAPPSLEDTPEPTGTLNSLHPVSQASSNTSELPPQSSPIIPQSSAFSQSSNTHSHTHKQLLNHAHRPGDITVLQKMLAACSGSLLTSLVVTPFDVVRVRLQQQGAFPIELLAAGTPATAPIPPSSKPTRLASVSASHLKPKFPPLQGQTAATAATPPIPAGLGVSTCCRSVFWFPSTVDYCIAATVAGGPSTQISACAKEEAAKRRFTGTWEGLKKISHYEGTSALWRGLGLTLLMSVPSNVVYFIGYEALRDNLPVQNAVITPLVAGAIARTLAATTVSPLELVKTRLQSVTSAPSPQAAFRTVMRGIKDMVAERGPFALWRGLVLTLWRDVPFSAIYWTAVEILRAQLRQTEYLRTHPEHHFVESFVAGCVGGSLAAILTSPFDVGKTRRQVGHHSSTSAQLGMFPFLRAIVKNEGVSALFVGAVPRVLKIAPACAIMITSYETGKRVFSQYNIDHPPICDDPL